MKRIFPLDAMRGMAALVVVIYHFQFFFKTPFQELLQPIYKGGWVVVDLFFVISGFILTRIYYSKRQDYNSVRRFVVHRLARLYPLHLLTLLVLCLILAINYYVWGRFQISLSYPYNDFYHFILNLLLLQWSGLQHGYSFNGPSWSISTEIILNFIFLGFAYLAGEAARKIIFVVTYLILICAELYGIHSLDPMNLRSTISFMSGVATAYILISTPDPTRNGIWKETSLCFIFLCCILFLIYWMYKYSDLGQHQLIERISHSILTVIVMPTAILTSINSNAISKLCETLPFRWLGDISYSVYLWHFPVVSIFYLFSIAIYFSPVELFSIYFISVFLLSHFSFICFEIPSRRSVVNFFVHDRAIA